MDHFNTGNQRFTIIIWANDSKIAKGLRIVMRTTLGSSSWQNGQNGSSFIEKELNSPPLQQEQSKTTHC